jgi:hypothetical protein
MRTIMTRRPRIETAGDGSVTLRVKLQPSTWALISRYAAKLGLNEEDAARIFLQQIDALIAADSLTWLSVDWRAIAKEVRAAGPTTPEIDVSKLHRSSRVKSGFFGVYANGQGFRAVGRRGAYIITAASAELAAWHRYQHYMQNGHPYGELEIEIDRLRCEGELGTDQDLRRVALETAKLTGTLHLYAEHMTPEEQAAYGTAGAGAQMIGFEGGPEAAAAALATHDPDVLIAGRDLPSSATHHGAPPLGRLISRRPKSETT